MLEFEHVLGYQRAAVVCRAARTRSGHPMIPTLILVGLYGAPFARGWLCLLVAAVGWPILLYTNGTVLGIGELLAVLSLAMANAGAGFAVGRSLSWFWALR